MTAQSQKEVDSASVSKERYWVYDGIGSNDGFVNTWSAAAGPRTHWSPPQAGECAREREASQASGEPPGGRRVGKGCSPGCSPLRAPRTGTEKRRGKGRAAFLKGLSLIRDCFWSLVDWAWCSSGTSHTGLLFWGLPVGGQLASRQDCSRVGMLQADCVSPGDLRESSSGWGRGRRKGVCLLLCLRRLPGRGVRRD